MDEDLQMVGLSREEAAVALRCSVSTIDKLVRTGRLDAARIGRATRISVESLRALWDEGPTE